MSEERLSFGGADNSYNLFHFSEHFARYAAVSALCRGKRVLDFSCGEGYGSHLMHEWGAASVVGVDVDKAAIEKASRLFGRDGVDFVCSSAEDILSVLRGQQFDLIISLETIEHVPDPKEMLGAIRALRAPEGVICISCPNDMAHEWVDNPYHLEKYSFDDFVALAEGVLGRADGWAFGFPLLGHMLLPQSLEVPVAKDALAILRGAQLPVEGCWLMPSQQNIAPTPVSASYYMGFWGGRIDGPTLAFSAQSLRGALGTWFELLDAKEQIRQLSEEKRRLSAELAASRDGLLGRRGLNFRAAESKWSKRRRRWKNSLKKRLPHAVYSRLFSD